MLTKYTKVALAALLIPTISYANESKQDDDHLEKRHEHQSFKPPLVYLELYHTTKGDTMKLIQYWRKSWRWLSVQAGAVVTLLPVAWVSLPDETKDIIPDAWLPWIVTAVGLAVVIGRLIDQPDETE